MSVKDHYENHLAHFYSWMHGDRLTHQHEFTAFLQTHQVKPRQSKRAIDFGAGHGLQSIPLAAIGFNVLAIDFNETLLAELNLYKNNLPVETMPADMRDVLKHQAASPELIVCCGDTLLHLESKNAIRQFLKDCVIILQDAGKLVLSFRDYSNELTGNARFIPVRQDDHRIATCVLEYTADVIHVTDLLYEKETTGWKQKISAYKKVRMTPNEIMDFLRGLEIEITHSEMIKGMFWLIAVKKIN